MMRGTPDGSRGGFFYPPASIGSALTASYASFGKEDDLLRSGGGGFVMMLVSGSWVGGTKIDVVSHSWLLSACW
jgi:hypothetical protein